MPRDLSLACCRRDAIRRRAPRRTIPGTPRTAPVLPSFCRELPRATQPRSQWCRPRPADRRGHRTGGDEQAPDRRGQPPSAVVTRRPDDRLRRCHVRRRRGAVGSTIRAVGADGADDRELTPPELEAGDPEWAPDGSSLLFSSQPIRVLRGEQPRPGSHAHYTMQADGSDVRSCRLRPVGAASWTATGTRSSSRTWRPWGHLPRHRRALRDTRTAASAAGHLVDWHACLVRRPATSP